MSRGGTKTSGVEEESSNNFVACGKQHVHGDAESCVNRDALVVVGLAGMALQLLRNTPGGKWQDDTSSHKAGEAIIASTHPNIYIFLVVSTAIAFLSALSAIFFILLGWPRKSKFQRRTTSCAEWVTLIAISMNYVGSTMAIAPHSISIPVLPIVTTVVMLGSIIISIHIRLLSS